MLSSAAAAPQVDSRAALATAWEEDATWLLPELRLWLKSGGEPTLARIWPHMLTEAATPVPLMKTAVKGAHRSKDGLKLKRSK